MEITISSQKDPLKEVLKYKGKEDGYREVSTETEGFEMIYGIPCPLPKLPKNNKDILNYNKPIEQQKWVRLPIPNDVIELCEEIEVCQDDALNVKLSIARPAFQREIFLSKKLMDHPFVKKEQIRKKYGVWIYIKGEPYWLSGHNYIFLQYWNMNVGAADYRDRDRRWFTFWNMCEKDPNCYGMIYMKHRQEGATSRVCCVNYNYNTTKGRRKGGIVSMDDEAARVAFREKLLRSYFTLPFYLRPSSLENKEQSSAIRWQRKTIHAGIRRASEEQSLFSSITYKGATVSGYDGETLALLHVDEGAKYRIDLDEFWERNRYPLSKGAGTKITGKAIFTSTVGVIDESNPLNAFKAGAAWRSMWYKSDYWTRNKNGQTSSGLYRYFLSAEDGLEGHEDEYGFPIKETARQHILNHLESLRTKKEKLSFKRTHPLTEADALTPDNPLCHFDIDMLKEQYQRLIDESENPESIFYKNNFLRGNFKWKGKRMEVEKGAYFEPSENGSWLIFNMNVMDIDPQESKFNRSKFLGKKKVVNNQTGEEVEINTYEPSGQEYVIGFDPYKVEKTVGERTGSNAAATVFMRGNINDSEGGNRPVAFYLGRGYSNEEEARKKSTLDQTHESILAGAYFFSAKILYEYEVQDFLHFCDKCGALGYLLNTPSSLMTKLPSQINKKKDESQIIKGASGKNPTKELGIRYAEDYVYEHIHKNPFVDLIEDMIGFDINNSTKFDLTISFLLALIAAYEPPKIFKESAKVDISIFNYF